MINVNQLPDGDCVITHNETVRLLALQLGVLERIKIPPSTTRPAAFFYEIGDHPSHWIYFVLHEGNQNPEDDGYMFFGFPKSRHSKKTAADRIQEYKDGTGFSAESTKTFRPPDSMS